MNNERYSDYDNFAWVYNRHWGSHSKGIIPVLEKLIFSNIPENGIILDLCCGTGQLDKALTDRGYRVTGVDGSEEMIEFARENAPEADFIVEDARYFTIPDRFDATLSLFDSLNHVMELKELETVFKNVYSVLKPGGIFLFDLNMKEGFEKRWKGSFNLVEDDHVCAIRSCYDQDSKIGKFEVTVFRFFDDWIRSDVSLLQRCYPQEKVVSALRKAGFQDIRAFDAISNLGLKDVGRTYFLGNTK
ncbi:MAG: class I SAM-dependent methyltransferase [bacterium]